MVQIQLHNMSSYTLQQLHDFVANQQAAKLQSYAITCYVTNYVTHNPLYAFAHKGKQ